jgi:hypothetical protein
LEGKSTKKRGGFEQGRYTGVHLKLLHLFDLTPNPSPRERGALDSEI